MVADRLRADAELLRDRRRAIVLEQEPYDLLLARTKTGQERGALIGASLDVDNTGAYDQRRDLSHRGLELRASSIFGPAADGSRRRHSLLLEGTAMKRKTQRGFDLLSLERLAQQAAGFDRGDRDDRLRVDASRHQHDRRLPSSSNGIGEVEAEVLLTEVDVADQQIGRMDFCGREGVRDRVGGGASNPHAAERVAHLIHDSWIAVDDERLSLGLRRLGILHASHAPT
jgi:hypothetical protein